MDTINYYFRCCSFMFSRKNPNNLCRFESICMQVLGFILAIPCVAILAGIFAIIVTSVIAIIMSGLGVIMSYIIYHNTYNIYTGCAYDLEIGCNYTTGRETICSLNWGHGGESCFVIGILTTGSCVIIFGLANVFYLWYNEVTKAVESSQELTEIYIAKKM